MDLDQIFQKRFARDVPPVPGGPAGVVGSGSSGPGGTWADDQPLAARLRWLIFPSIFLVYLAQTAIGVSRVSHGLAAVGGYVVLGMFCLAYVAALYQSRGRYATDDRVPWLFLSVLVALTAVEAVFAHEDAFVMLIYVLVLAIARLGGRALPVVVGAVVASAFVPPLIPSWHAPVQGNLAVSMAVVSFAMWAFFGVVKVNRDLGRARAEVARLAAENERTRIARDLHDLLGHSLTAITVKAGLAHRLAAVDPGRAAEEIAEVEALARQSLADVRAAVSGYREVTVAGELASGRELLRAAGVDARFPGAVDAVAPANQELFGWVVREGLTNVVRHARASTCEVRLGANWVEVVDDGGGRDGLGAGKGLTGLRERVVHAGGTVTSGPRRDGVGGWALRVEVPAGAAGRGKPATDRPSMFEPCTTIDPAGVGPAGGRPA